MQPPPNLRPYTPTSPEYNTDRTLNGPEAFYKSRAADAVSTKRSRVGRPCEFVPGAPNVDDDEGPSAEVEPDHPPPQAAERAAPEGAQVSKIQPS
jgi:hypothetical protein